MSVLITGSSRGLGLDLGNFFLKDGHEVAFHSRKNIGFLADQNIHFKSAIEITCELANYVETKNCLLNLFKTKFLIDSFKKSSPELFGYLLSNAVLFLSSS